MHASYELLCTRVCWKTSDKKGSFFEEAVTLSDFLTSVLYIMVSKMTIGKVSVFLWSLWKRFCSQEVALSSFQRVLAKTDQRVVWSNSMWRMWKSFWIFTLSYITTTPRIFCDLCEKRFWTRETALRSF